VCPYQDAGRPTSERRVHRYAGNREQAQHFAITERTNFLGSTRFGFRLFYREQGIGTGTLKSHQLVEETPRRSQVIVCGLLSFKSACVRSQA